MSPHVKSLENAEEVLMLGFCKVFTKIHSYTGKGNFEGWIRRIMVNESLMFIRKKYRFDEHVDIQEIPMQGSQATVLDELAAQDIIDMMMELQQVTALYFLCDWGYKHKEIAEMLGIISTHQNLNCYWLRKIAFNDRGSSKINK